MKRDKKMLDFRVGFWTNNLPMKDKNSKLAWSHGVVYLYANKERGIKPQLEYFKDLTEIPAILMRLMVKEGIKLGKDVTEVDYVDFERELDKLTKKSREKDQ